ncbi:MAG: serine/threonine-protein kinase [Rhodanobacteraceae bacterium]
MTQASDPLRELLDRIADGGAIDWDQAGATEAPLLDALYTLDAVRNAYQRIGAADAPQTQALFHWGHLAVQEKIGSGATAEVYRAWDPGLSTTVALKLLKPEAAAAGLRSDEFLREGRLLARISQRNVLRIYGAAVHDGRPGLWNECIDGRTLDAIVEADGPLAASETAHIGLELLAGLRAIHAEGLLHGDIKASNAMRARGGRIVLTDLGACGTADALNASLCTQATPAYLSPQAQDGAPRGKADDLYALGVLLHFLATGAYPREGARRVRDTAPKTDPQLAAVIDRALDPEPQRRFADAEQFADALRASLGVVAVHEKAPPQRALIGIVAVLLALAAGFAWWSLRTPAWHADVELVRRTDTGNETLRDGAQLHVGDRVELTLTTNRPTWAYVFNEDSHGDFHVLFPLAGLELSNPLPENKSVVLPGRQAARSLSWEVSDASGREEFLVLLANAPLATLEQRLATLPSAAIAEPQRGVAKTRVNPPGDLRLRGEHLNTLLAGLGDALKDGERVRLRAWRFNERASE